MESTDRCKPLLTCVVSMLGIASKVYTRTQHFEGPIGSTTDRMVNIASRIFPFLRLFQCFLLTIISFTDDRILSLEKVIQTAFPPSSKLFDKIDNYAHTAESLPAKFDAALDKFPTIAHKVPFLDWALVIMISWLKFLISTLTRFGSNTYKEKEIVVDTSSNNHRKEKESVSKYNTKNGNVSDLTPEIFDVTNVVKPPIISDITKISYKEILEKGKKENDEKEEDNKVTDNSDVDNGNIKSEKNSKVSENENSEGNGIEDPILELFAASWHMKPPKAAKNNPMSRSASYA